MIDEKIKALDEEKHSLLTDIETLNNLEQVINLLKSRLQQRALNIQHLVMHAKVEGIHYEKKT